MSLRFGSLFSGIGAFDYGLEQAGMTCAYQIEVDPWCRRVLTKHWPLVPKWSDIREVRAADLPPVGLLAGGFPCVDISDAGKRAGIDGERSGLWREFHRLVREIRPRYVLVENVGALLYRGLDRVLGDLAACGYDAEWQGVSAAACGAPHIRERVFVVAYPGRPGDGQTGRPTEVERAAGAVERAGMEPLLDHALFSRAARPDPPRLRWRAPARSEWSPEPGIRRVVDGSPYRMDRLRGLGNAVVPQVARFIGGLILEAEGRP
jgi:DNA (cytosine-5)-methyltransferase 1